MKIFPILSCNLSNIELIKYAFAHLVLLNCKFRHTKTLFSDHQNSVKSSPQSRKWHFRDSEFKNFLGPLALAFSPPNQKELPTTLPDNNGLLTEREVCTVKYQTEVFSVWTERRRSEVHAKNRGLIFHSTDRTSEVNNRFIIWLN